MSEPPVVADAWDDYWRHTREAAAHKGGGPQDEVLARFWTSYFAEAYARSSRRRLIDIGCGNGSVASFAVDASKPPLDPLPFLVGVDNSFAALRAFSARFPAAAAVAADANRLPFKDRQFDIVTSQFSVEYAGLEAIEAAARLVSTGGSLALIMHLKGGAMYRECATNLEAVRALQRSRLLASLKQIFEAGQAAAPRPVDGSDAADARARLVQAMREVEATLNTHGKEIAGGALYRVHEDVAHMHRRRDAFAPEEIVHWVDVMTREFDAYAERMSAMLGAAIDEQEFDACLTRLTAQGLALRIRGKLEMGVRHREPAAWVLVCDRP